MRVNLFLLSQQDYAATEHTHSQCYATGPWMSSACPTGGQVRIEKDRQPSQDCLTSFVCTKRPEYFNNSRIEHALINLNKTHSEGFTSLPVYIDYLQLEEE